MDFRLKVFHSVATNLSFTKASKELFISQPAISKHIHELEVQYKTPLFDRVGSRIALTHAGELLLSHTKLLLSAYRQMDFEMNLLTDNFSGELRLGASTTISQYVLPPVLSSFIQKFPEIKISLQNGNSRDIEQALREGRITLGLVEGTAHQSTLHYTPFMKDELVVVAHTGSSLAVYDEITIEQLCTLPLVLRENGSGTLDVVEASIRKRHPDRIIEDVIALHDVHHPLLWGVEAVQFQEFFAHVLVQRAAERGIALPVRPLANSADKLLRIESLQPHMAQGRIRLHASQQALIDQLRHFPRADHDDGPDALEMLWRLASTGFVSMGDAYIRMPLEREWGDDGEDGSWGGERGPF